MGPTSHSPALSTCVGAAFDRTAATSAVFVIGLTVSRAIKRKVLPAYGDQLPVRPARKHPECKAIRSTAKLGLAR